MSGIVLLYTTLVTQIAGRLKIDHLLRSLNGDSLKS